jgi:hypothetical protein
MVACLVLKDITRIAYRNAIYNYGSFCVKDKRKEEKEFNAVAWDGLNKKETWVMRLLL